MLFLYFPTFRTNIFTTCIFRHLHRQMINIIMIFKDTTDPGIIEIRFNQGNQIKRFAIDANERFCIEQAHVSCYHYFL